MHDYHNGEHVYHAMEQEKIEAKAAHKPKDKDDIRADKFLMASLLKRFVNFHFAVKPVFTG